MSEVVEGSRIGALLREWRQRRRLSQLDLALEAGVSTRHLSFVETGRARPSADMVLHLAEQLDVPLVLDHPDGRLCFISTVTTFGTALDITVAELAIEAFFPADDATASRLRALL